MNGSFHSHSHLFLLHLPFLGDLICEACRTTHQRMVIFLPHVRSELMEMALLELYLRGDASKLSDILDATIVNKQPVKEELLEDTDVSNIQSDEEKTIGHKLININAENRAEHISTDTTDIYNSDTDNYKLFANMGDKINKDKGLDQIDMTDHNKTLSDVTFSSNTFVQRRCTLDNCGKEFSSMYGLNIHRKKIHGLGKDGMKLECPICGKIVVYLNIHIKACHKDTIESRGYGVCEVCMKKVDNMKQHRGVCTSCPLCQYKNSKKARLLKHMDTYHGHDGDAQLEPVDLSC